MSGRQTYTIRDRKTDATEEMIKAKSRMVKRIHMRFYASRMEKRMDKRIQPDWTNDAQSARINDPYFIHYLAHESIKALCPDNVISESKFLAE
jgi:hypothetical protein